MIILRLRVKLIKSTGIVQKSKTKLCIITCMRLRGLMMILRLTKPTMGTIGMGGSIHSMGANGKTWEIACSLKQ